MNISISRFLALLLMALSPLTIVEAQINYSTPYTFTTFAGLPSYGNVDGTGSDARFNGPSGLDIDSSGNIYVADTGNNTVRKITPAGEVSTIAGSILTPGSMDGIGSDAQFNAPSDLIVDARGNLFVTDTSNGTVRKITNAGLVTTYAGVASLAGSDDGPRDQAKFQGPFGTAKDGADNIYLADIFNHTIRKISTDGVVSTIAGSDRLYGSVDGVAGDARFSGPTGVVVSNNNDVYVVDRSNHTIRKITASGVVTTIAGSVGVAGTADGMGTTATFNFPQGLCMDALENIYVADTGNHTLRKISPLGVVSTLAGTAGIAGAINGTGTNAQFNHPTDVAIDSSGNLFVTDRDNNMIRKISSSGVVTTLAGARPATESVDGFGHSARFSYPLGVAVDAAGNVFVGDSSRTIRKITPAGVVTTFAGNSGNAGSADGIGTNAYFYSSGGVAADSAGNVYVADTYNHTIRKISSTGVVTTLAGLAGNAGIGAADGTGSAARFWHPYGLAVDSSGNVYVSDYTLHTIRKVSSSGVVTTLAGSPFSYGSADGVGSAARFQHPEGVAVDSEGNLYVADTGNNVIRKVTSDGLVSTYAGYASISGGERDGAYDYARFTNPIGVTVDSAGNLFVTEGLTNVIRQISSSREVSTIAGVNFTPTLLSHYADGTGSTVRFSSPAGIAVDGSGNLYVADSVNNTIRKGVFVPVAPSDAVITITVE